MTKVTQPLGSSEARGKVGGYCYNTWRGISYVKTIKTPANQNTARRLAVRALAKQCTTRWQTITDLQRTWWNDYAKTHLDPYWTGNDKRISGYNWFLRANFRLLDIGLSIINTPPSRPNPWPLATLLASVLDDKITVTWTLPAGATAPDLQVDVWYTAALSAGKAPKIENAKHKAYVAAEAGTYTTPPLAHGHYGVFARTIDESTGLATPWRLVQTTVVAGYVYSRGPNYPLLGITRGERLPEWTTPENIYVQDTITAALDLMAFDETDDLLGTNFLLAIPSSATILGIKLEYYYECSIPTKVMAHLFTGGLPKGDELEASIPSAVGEWLTLGSATELWGTTWTPAELNDPTFGAYIYLTEELGDSGSPSIDAYRITVYYTT